MLLDDNFFTCVGQIFGDFLGHFEKYKYLRKNIVLLQLVTLQTTKQGLYLFSFENNLFNVVLLVPLLLIKEVKYITSQKQSTARVLCTKTLSIEQLMYRVAVVLLQKV